MASGVDGTEGWKDIHKLGKLSKSCREFVDSKTRMFRARKLHPLDTRQGDAMTYLGSPLPPGSLLKGEKTRKSPAKRNKKLDHLAFIRMLPCLATGKNPPCDAAHIRYADPACGKPYTAKSMKADDEWAVPLSREAHSKQHSMNEEDFWANAGIDPCKIAMRLWAISGDVIEGTRIIRELHNRREK